MQTDRSAAPSGGGETWICLKHGEVRRGPPLCPECGRRLRASASSAPAGAGEPTAEQVAAALLVLESECRRQFSGFAVAKALGAALRAGTAPAEPLRDAVQAVLESWDDKIRGGLGPGSLAAKLYERMETLRALAAARPPETDGDPVLRGPFYVRQWVSDSFGPAGHAPTLRWYGVYSEYEEENFVCEELPDRGLAERICEILNNAAARPPASGEPGDG